MNEDKPPYQENACNGECKCYKCLAAELRGKSRLPPLYEKCEDIPGPNYRDRVPKSTCPDNCGLPPKVCNADGTPIDDYTEEEEPEDDCDDAKCNCQDRLVEVIKGKSNIPPLSPFVKGRDNILKPRRPPKGSPRLVDEVKEISNIPPLSPLVQGCGNILRPSGAKCDCSIPQVEDTATQTLGPEPANPEDECASQTPEDNSPPPPTIEAPPDAVVDECAPPVEDDDRYCTCSTTPEDGDLNDEFVWRPPPLPSCLHCGASIRGDNENCFYCSITRRARDPFHYEYRCPDSIFSPKQLQDPVCIFSERKEKEKCFSDVFDLTPEGKPIYEGGMCLTRAMHYFWKTNPVENSWKLFGIQNQRYDGFYPCGRGRVGEENTCTCDQHNKYKGGMSLEEVEDWNWNNQKPKPPQ